MSARIRKTAAVFAIAIFAAAALWTIYVQRLIQTVQSAVLPEKADVAIVLGAKLWNDSPSPALRERLDRAASLYREGVVPHIVVSGGLDAGGAKVTEAEGMKRYLTNMGIPQEAISEENRSTSTYENLLFTKAIMNRHGWKQAIIVTHSYHGARALDIASFIGIPNAAVAAVDSKVLWMPWHKARETLAYGKWVMDRTLYQWKLKAQPGSPS